MKHLLIVGARGFGREVYNLFLDCNYSGMDCKGFIDDKTDALDDYKSYPPIVSSVENYVPEKDDVFICALGDVRYKEKYVNMIRDKKGTFISLVHPAAVIGRNTTVGVGCIIGNAAMVSCDVTIGDFVTIMPKAALGHDVTIGDWSHIGSFSFMGGFSQLGKGVTIHPSANILPKIKINDYASVGTGSVVLRTVKERTTVFGIPAKQLLAPTKQ